MENDAFWSVALHNMIIAFHDDILIWKAFCSDMETLSALLTLSLGNPPFTCAFSLYRPSNVEFGCFLLLVQKICWTSSWVAVIWGAEWSYDITRAATSTDFRNRLTGPPNSNRIQLTKRFASPYGALCFHVFTDSDSPPGPSHLSLQVVLLLVSNQISFMQIKRRSKIITFGVLMHKNKSLT